LFYSFTRDVDLSILYVQVYSLTSEIQIKRLPKVKLYISSKYDVFHVHVLCHRFWKLGIQDKCCPHLCIGAIKPQFDFGLECNRLLYGCEVTCIDVTCICCM